MANYGAEGRKRMMCADCGSHKMSRICRRRNGYILPRPNEPDMVSSSSFDNPTNANYSAEGETVADVESSVEPANEPIAVAEGTSLDGYAPLDSLSKKAHQSVTVSINSLEAQKPLKAHFLMNPQQEYTALKRGVSLENFSGVDSVVVEAPLGHGVTQWYAEDSPEPRI